MKATKTFTYEVFKDETGEKIAKGEFTIEYNDRWWSGAVYAMATEKCRQLAELFWDGSHVWCKVNSVLGEWCTDYDYTED